MDTRCAPCSWGFFAPRPFQWIAHGYTHVHTHIMVRTHARVWMHTCTHTCFKNRPTPSPWGSSLSSPILVFVCLASSNISSFRFTQCCNAFKYFRNGFTHWTAEDAKLLKGSSPHPTPDGEYWVHKLRFFTFLTRNPSLSVLWDLHCFLQLLWTSLIMCIQFTNFPCLDVYFGRIS